MHPQAQQVALGRADIAAKGWQGRSQRRVAPEPVLRCQNDSLEDLQPAEMRLSVLPSSKCSALPLCRETAAVAWHTFSQSTQSVAPSACPFLRTDGHANKLLVNAGDWPQLRRNASSPGMKEGGRRQTRLRLTGGVWEGRGGVHFEEVEEGIYLRQLSHVEEVVEFGRGRQHLALDLVPESNGHWHQLGSNIHHLLLIDVWIKATLYMRHMLQSKP